ncbi:hypothetical protein [Stenotrophomonas phage RAS14]
MFNTIKAKINLYKWGFISLSVLALTVAIAVQTVRLNNVKHEAEGFKETVKTQTAQIDDLKNSLMEYQRNTEEAFKALDALREDLKRIDGDTRDLKRRNIAPKVEKGGANAADLEVKANDLSNSIFSRLENASKE